MKVSRNIYISSGGIIPSYPFDITLNTEESIATYAWAATNSLKQNNTPVSDGEIIYQLINLKDGPNLVSAGITNPAHLGTLPILKSIQRSRPYTTFFNAPNYFYVTEQIPIFTYPYAISDVMEFLPGQSYEGFRDGGNDGFGRSLYTGNFGTGLRMGGSNPDYYVLGNANIPYYTRTLVTWEVTSITLNIYINGTLADTKPLPDQSDSTIGVGLDKLTRYALGVSTNNSLWNSYIMYVYQGQDYINYKANQTTIDTSIKDKWLVGEVNPNPYAYNPSTNAEITFTYNQTTGALTPIYSWHNATSEQIATEEITWTGRYYHTLTPGNFTRQQVVSTNKIANYNDIINLSYTNGNIGGTTDGDTITGLQALYYTVKIPGFDEVKSVTLNLPLTST